MTETDTKAVGVVSTLERIRDVLDRTVAASPSRMAIFAFSLVIVFFSVMLLLPISSADGQSVALHHAIFTATSAVTVTGLTTVSTATQWSFFGQLMILIAFQIGGLGTLTMTSLLAMAVGRKLGLRSRLIAQEAMNIGKLGELGSVLRTVATTSIGFEATIALILIPRFLLLGESFGESIWHGIFYAVSAFNNAGFTPHSDGIVPYGHDLWILIPICVGVFIGSLGFPVILVIQQNPLSFSRWNLTTKLTIIGTVALMFIGMALWGLFEWSNPKTIGDLNFFDKILNALFASIMTRSGGFNLVDMNDANPITLLITDVLMFIGGGSASTAGGIKITTITVVILAVIAEARGDTFVVAFNRTIPDSVLRIAISVIMMSAIIVFIGTAMIVFLSGETLDRVLFEVISAYATCGLSVGLSPVLPPSCIYVLSVLMFVGRIGIITVATGLALRSRRRLYKFPEERPIIG
ncbi:potassium transporter TrkG [Rothia sp. LK2588]|uniref:TrkH family potassium uptake protein n=1 Tax=Rothia sp. LK2588 TaxID=3114369 RepID=UPI0034CFC217